MKLIKPNSEFEEQYRAALEEGAGDSGDTILVTPKEGQSFSAFVQKLNKQSDGEELPEGYVPASTFWLVDDGVFVGRVSIRHHLNEALLKHGGHIGYYIRRSKRQKGYGTAILRLALEEARRLGITRALVTCDDTNEASCKIIEANGGVLENIIEHEEKHKPLLRRYWIDLS